MTRIGSIDTAELRLFYQPQVTADGARIVGMEALIRRQHPHRGMMAPNQFLPALIESELEELDWWVLAQAAKDLERWPDTLVSINIAATQLQRDNFADRILDAIRAAGREMTSFELEIVESSVVADFDKATKNVVRLREAGVRVALDDFGTGYSSLTYLLEFPLDKVKIDRSFIQKSYTLKAAAIIQAVAALARATGLKITAEGVETEAQQRFLRTVGCHYLQGYLFAKPMDADDLLRLIARWETRERPGPAAPSAAG